LGARGWVCIGLCNWRWHGLFARRVVVNMTKDEALKLALEALQKIYIAPEHEEYIRVWWPACEQAIIAIKDTLTQPEPVGVNCDCPYLNIHDAVVKDHDTAMALLQQCLDEMRYAGWNKPIADQQGRWSVFGAVLNYLHPEIRSAKHD
jgi:hypothetical protein